jgi:hypothetical protein
VDRETVQCTVKDDCGTGYYHRDDTEQVNFK